MQELFERVKDFEVEIRKAINEAIEEMIADAATILMLDFNVYSLCRDCFVEASCSFRWPCSQALGFTKDLESRNKPRG